MGNQDHESGERRLASQAQYARRREFEGILPVPSATPICGETWLMNTPEHETETQSNELTDRWEAELAALDERLRASGRTVTVMEPSNTSEFVASFPQGREPGRNVPTSHEPDATTGYAPVRREEIRGRAA